MKDKLTAEAVAYFRGHAILLRLAKEFCSKYRSLGHFCGRVSLSVLTLDEQRDLAAFLRRKIGKADSVSYKEFFAAWEKTRFGSLSLPDFLLSLMPENFMTKREERQQEQAKRQELMDRLLDICVERNDRNAGIRFFKDILEKGLVEKTDTSMCVKKMRAKGCYYLIPLMVLKDAGEFGKKQQALR